MKLRFIGAAMRTSLVFTAVVSTHVALAQESAGTGRVLEEVVVTAERRTENIMNVPIAITALSGDALVDRQITGLDTLQQATPSLQFTNEEGSFANLSIRGVGNPILGLDVEPAVALIQDGVPYASQWVNLADFFDVNSVQVLRGPQGTISGRNATGGAILIQSNLPTKDFQGMFKTTLGKHNLMGAEGFLSGPLVGERLLGRLAVRALRADGWAENTLLDQELGDLDKLDARATLLAHFTDDLEGQLILQTIHDRSTFFLVEYGRVRPDTPTLSEYLGLTTFDRDSGTLQHNQPSNTDIRKNQATLKFDWQLGESARLVSLSSYVHSRVRLATDLDATAAPGFLTEPGVPYTKVWQASQELTFTADLTDRIDVILGALYLKQDANNIIGFGAPLIGIPPGALNYDQTVILNSRGVYSQWRYRLTDTVRLTAGVRRVSDSKSTSADEVLFGTALRVGTSESWKAWTPRFSLEYTPSKDLSFYATASKGFKSGGFNSLSTPITAYAPESLWNYEIGMKSSLLSDRLKASAAAFSMDYKNLQTTVLGIDPSSAFSAQIINAPTAKIRGIELELDALLTDHWRVGFGGTWLDSKYGDFQSADSLYPELGTPGPVGLNLRDVKDNRLVNAPKYQFNVSAEYRHALWTNVTGIVRGSYAWQDRFYIDIFNNEGMSQEAYGLVNLSAGVETDDGRWKVSAYVTNLTDKFYITSKSVQPTGPVPMPVSMPGAPRMYAASVEYRF